jgi:hypothetical protein
MKKYSCKVTAVSQKMTKEKAKNILLKFASEIENPKKVNLQKFANSIKNPKKKTLMDMVNSI